jgi:hypothetical protein
MTGGTTNGDISSGGGGGDNVALANEVRRLRQELKEARTFKPNELSIIRKQHQQEIEERLVMQRSDHQMELKVPPPISLVHISSVSSKRGCAASCDAFLMQ